MPSTTTEHRYRCQANYALERLRQHHAAGDPVRFAEWHQHWSLAEAVVAAEIRERGGGVRLLRSSLGAGLRLLPPELQDFLPPPTLPSGLLPLESPPERSVPEEVGVDPEEMPTLPPLPGEALKQSLLRRGLLLQALHAGGPNPFPAELSKEDWEYHLLTFQEEGPMECQLLQQVEEALEFFLEMVPTLPEPEDGTLFLDEKHELTTGTLPVCIEIYRESLAGMTETELSADLYTCLEAGRADTVALIEAEIARRERETDPDLVGVSPLPLPQDQDRNEGLAGGEPQEPHAPVAPALAEKKPGESVEGQDSFDPQPTTKKSGHRRRAAPYSATPSPSSSSVQPQRPVSPPLPPVEPEPTPTQPGCATAPAWIDATGRTRTWALLDADGEKLAEITTRSGAEKLAALLNRLQRPAREDALPE